MGYAESGAAVMYILLRKRPEVGISKLKRRKWFPCLLIFVCVYGRHQISNAVTPNFHIVSEKV